MAARHVFALSLGLSLTSFALTPLAFAVDEEGIRNVPEVDNAKYQFIGKVNASGVTVRSGPSNNFYATQKLEKDEEVTVVGIKADWLKIVPPAGSFSYVPQAYVTRRGNGKVGRVDSSLNVRAGSSVNAMKTTVQMKLDAGADVEIIEAQEEYFKIVPPTGAYLYINKQYVTPVAVKGKPAGEIAEAKPEAPSTTDVEKPAAPETGTELKDDVAISETPTKPESDTPDTQPATANKDDAGETTAVNPVAAAEDFRKLEAEFEAASKQPVIDQPLEHLTERYTALSQTGGLTGTSKRIVDARLRALKIRTDTREQLVAFRKSQDEMNNRQRDLQIEKQEIDERIAATKVTMYTAVGMLRVSSLQQGNQTLYRLTDPASGRTVVYIRSNDPKLVTLLNQFVGVRGELASDERLKMKLITPEESEIVDASKVNGTVIATITPPSMMPIANTSDPADTAH